MFYQHAPMKTKHYASAQTISTFSLSRFDQQGNWFEALKMLGFKLQPKRKRRKCYWNICPNNQEEWACGNFLTQRQFWDLKMITLWGSSKWRTAWKIGRFYVFPILKLDKFAYDSLMIWSRMNLIKLRTAKTTFLSHSENWMGRHFMHLLFRKN